MNENNQYYYGSVSDRIGSEGLISVLGFKYNGKYIYIENYILSCRVFGRYIEEVMLLPVFEYAISVKSDIYFDFIDTTRNRVVKEFIHKLTNSNTNYLPLKKIVEFKSQFSKLPVNIENNL